MLTITEKNGSEGFKEEAIVILQKYIEDIYKYKYNEKYFIFKFLCKGETRYSFYVKRGSHFVRMFSHDQTLQPFPSFNQEDQSITGKRGTKICARVKINDITYVADNYHPCYINKFVAVEE